MAPEYSIGLPAPFHIPTEVCENIIDMLYSSNSSLTLEDIATLRSCALVCQDWRVRSQRVLFYKVQLYDSAALHRLSMILDAGQHLRDYVHEIVLTGHYLQTTASIFALFPAVFARRLPNLTSIDVGKLQDCDAWWYPRRSDPPQAKLKPLPYIPLHPRFPHFLSCFTGVNILLLYSTTFHSFNEFARMLHGLRNLETLVCNSVRWITLGASHAGADFAKPPDWAAGRKSPGPPFAPRLHRLWLRDIALDGACGLISTRGPHLTWLGMTIPLGVNLEEPIDEGEIDLSTCSGLGTLHLAITPEFSGVQLKSILTSWKPRHAEPFLALQAYGHSRFTRQGFADVLSSVGAITDAWLRLVEASTYPEGSENSNGVQYQLMVEIYDWEAERKWWSNYVASCFPTWLQLGRLHMDFATPPNRSWEWKEDAEEPSSQSTTRQQPPLADVDPSPSSSKYV